MKVFVSVSLPEYLAQFIRYHLNSTDSTVTPVKGSALSSFLRMALRHKSDCKEKKSVNLPVESSLTNLDIIVPHFPGRDPFYYNYLSPTAESQLRDLLRQQLDLSLFTDFSRFDARTVQRSEFIWSWMDANGIELNEKNWCAIDKRLQILQRKARDRKRKKIS